MAVEDLGMDERRDIAVALQLLLVDIHRARHIDRKDELEIDRHVGRPSERERRRPEDGGEQQSERTPRHGIVSLPPTLQTRVMRFAARANHF